MKKVIWILVLIMFSTVAFAQADIERGDSEFGFNASYTNSDGFDYGLINLSYNYYLTSHLKVGIGPTITIGNDDVSFAGTFTTGYNFSNSGRMIPYVDVYWYQMDFAPEYLDFIDYSYINFGLGLKSFFNQYVALDTRISYGLALSEHIDVGIFQIISGISVFF